MKQREKVAELRRGLPEGATIQDYEFLFMYGKKQTKPSRGGDDTLRHFYSVHPWMAPDIHERGIDEYNPIWNILDLTPQGRGNWSASLDYGTTAQARRA